MRVSCVLIPVLFLVGCGPSTESSHDPNDPVAAAWGPDWSADLETRENRPVEHRRWEAHQGPVTAMVFSEDGRRLVTIGYHDKRVSLWDVDSGRRVNTLNLENRPRDLVWIPGGEAVAVLDAKGVVSHIPVDPEGLVTPRPLDGRAGRGVGQLAVDPSGRMLATTNFEDPVRLWDLDQSTLVGEIDGSAGQRGVCFADRDRLVTGSHSNTFTDWKVNGPEASRGKTRRVPKAGDQSDVWTVACDRSGRYLLTGHMDTSISLWDLGRGKELHNFYVQDASVLNGGFSPDGSVFAVALQNGAVLLWDRETRASLAQLRHGKEGVEGLAFSPTQRLLASGGGDGTVVLWR